MSSKKSSKLNWVWRSLIVFAMISAFFSGPAPTQAAVPTGYTEFFIPGSTDQLFAIFQDIDNDPNLSNDPNDDGDGQNDSNQMHSVISVAIAADNVTVYYDHWENGYGSGSSADETYTGNTGDVLTFESADIVVPRAVGNTCTSSNPSNPTPAAGRPCYDGRDRIFVVGGTVTVGRASWPEVTDTVFALAWEVYPVKPYLTSYVIPVGEDLATAQGYNDFTNTYLTVQSTSDNNTIQITDPINGAQPPVVLNRGEVTEIFHFNAGTTVTASFPVQVQFVVGQAHAGMYSEARGYTAVPSGLWDSAYYNPVPGFASTDGGEDTEIYIYNPTSSSLSINYQDRDGSGTFSIPANSTRSYSSLTSRTVPQNSAVILEATDGATNFWAIGSGGTQNTTSNANANYDFGFSLVPRDLLENEYFLSWTPGTNDLSANGSPVFVTTTEDDTTVFVDFDPTTSSVDATYLIDRLEVLRLFDTSDNNMSGAHVWSTAPIALVWGEDPDVASVGNPYLDVGYTSLPLPEAWMDVVMTLDKTADPPSVEPSPGQIVTFMLTVATDTTYDVDDIDIVDVLPPGWSYVNNSTLITLPDNSTQTPNPSIASQTLTWTLGINLEANEEFTLEYQAVYDGTSTEDFGCNEATASGTRNSGSEDHEATDQFCVYYSNLEMEKSSSAAGSPVYPGDTIDYTIVITNSGGTTQNNIVVSDTVPVGTTFVSGTVDGYTGSTAEFRDDFDTGGGYLQSSGTTDWSTQGWDENGDDDSATSGTIQITGDELRFRNPNGDSIERVIPANFTGISAFMDIDYRETGSWENDDDFWVEMWNGSGWSIIIQETNDFSDPAAQTGVDIGSICAACLNANPQIRLRSDADGSGSGEEYIYIDYIRFYFTDIQTVTGAAINNPPNIIQASDGYLLEPGQTMTINYQVMVDDPLAFGLDAIFNTASVTSDENNTPLEDTVSDPVALGSIGNYVWLDENGDGVQDAGEAGIPNVVVELYDSLGTLVATTTTDANGDYIFQDVPVGDYSVVVPPFTGWVPTYDEDGGGDSVSAVTLTTDGQYYETTDFGYQPALAVGGTLWDDTDDDDGSAVGDPGIPNVEVQLWSVDGSGAPLALLDTTLTDVNGNYLFNGLGAGEYIVIIPVDPPGFSASVAGTSDPDNNVDNDDNGAPGGSGISVQSLPITLETLDGSYNGQEPDTGEDGDLNRSNLTLDFGFTLSPTAVTLAGFSASTGRVPVWAVALAALVLILLIGAAISARRKKEPNTTIHFR